MERKTVNHFGDFNISLTVTERKQIEQKNKVIEDLNTYDQHVLNQQNILF